MTVALRRPEETRPFAEKPEVVVQIHPVAVRFAQHHARGATSEIDAADVDPALAARLCLDPDGIARGRPVHARQVLDIVPEVELSRAGRIADPEHVERHHGVRIAGLRVRRAVPRTGRVLEVGHFEGRNAAHVDPRESEGARVGGPPVAGGTIHLLLGHELGGAPRDARIVARGHGDLARAGDLANEEVVAAQVRHPAAIGRQVRVELGLRRFGQSAGLATGCFDDPRIAGERHEDPCAVVGDLEARHPALRLPLPFTPRLLLRRNGARCSERRCVDDHPHPCGCDFERHETLIGVPGTAAQEVDVAAVGCGESVARDAAREPASLDQPFEEDAGLAVELGWRALAGRRGGCEAGDEEGKDQALHDGSSSRTGIASWGSRRNDPGVLTVWLA